MSNLGLLQQEFNNGVTQLLSELYASKTRDPRTSILALMPIANHVKNLGRILNVGAEAFPPAILQFFGQIQLRHTTYLASDLENRPDIVLDTAFLQTLPPPSIPTHKIVGPSSVGAGASGTSASRPTFVSPIPNAATHPAGKPPGGTLKRDVVPRPPLATAHVNLPLRSHPAPSTTTPVFQPLLPALLPTDPIAQPPVLTSHHTSTNPIAETAKARLIKPSHADGEHAWEREEAAIRQEGMGEEENVGEEGGEGSEGLWEDEGEEEDRREVDGPGRRRTAKRDNAHLTSPPGKHKKKTKLTFVEPSSEDDTSQGKRRVTRSRHARAKGTGKGKSKVHRPADYDSGASGSGKPGAVGGKGRTRGEVQGEEGNPPKRIGGGGKGKGKGKAEVQEDLGEHDGEDQHSDSELVGYGTSTMPCFVCKKANKPVCWREREGACHLCRTRKVACRFPAGAEYIPPSTPKATNPLEWAVFSLPDGARSGTAIDLSMVADKATLHVVSDAVQDLQRDIYGLSGRLHEKTTTDRILLTTLNASFDELEPVVAETEKRVTAVEKSLGNLHGEMKDINAEMKRFPDVSKMKEAIEEIDRQLQEQASKSLRPTTIDEGTLKEMVTEAVSIEVDSGIANAEARIQESSSQQRYLAAAELERKLVSLEERILVNVLGKVGNTVSAMVEQRLQVLDAERASLVERIERLEKSIEGAPECADAIATRVVAALNSKWPSIISPIVGEVFSTQLRERIGEMDDNIARVHGQLQQQFTEQIRHELNDHLKTLVRDAVEVTMENLVTMSRISFLPPAPPPIPSLIDPERISNAFSGSAQSEAEHAPVDDGAPPSVSAITLDDRLRRAIYDTALTALPDNISSVRIRYNEQDDK